MLNHRPNPTKQGSDAVNHENDLGRIPSNITTQKTEQQTKSMLKRGIRSRKERITFRSAAIRLGHALLRGKKLAIPQFVPMEAKDCSISKFCGHSGYVSDAVIHALGFNAENRELVKITSPHPEWPKRLQSAIRSFPRSSCRTPWISDEATRTQGYE